jgi:hypothetical protein
MSYVLVLLMTIDVVEDLVVGGVPALLLYSRG